MTDSEISRKLALAIGYTADQINATPYFCNVWHKTGPDSVNCAAWHRFDYADPLVIWPIAARYKCFPHFSQFDRPGRQWATLMGGKMFETATPEMAVALAVIEGSK
jgi:hypothetical protein